MLGAVLYRRHGQLSNCMQQLESGLRDVRSCQLWKDASLQGAEVEGGLLLPSPSCSPGSAALGNPAPKPGWDSWKRACWCPVGNVTKSYGILWGFSSRC